MLLLIKYLELINPSSIMEGDVNYITNLERNEFSFPLNFSQKGERNVLITKNDFSVTAIVVICSTHLSASPKQSALVLLV
jgi:hypothetical protein